MSDFSVTIEPMTAADLTAVEEIERESRVGRWGANGYREELRKKESLLLVARLNQKEGETVGFVFARLITPGVEIIEIAVRSEFRKMKIGERLLTAVFKEAREKGNDICWLEVRESNLLAIKFYEKQGFTRTGVRRNYYSDPVENAILFDKKIENNLS